MNFKKISLVLGLIIIVLVGVFIFKSYLSNGTSDSDAINPVQNSSIENQFKPDNAELPKTQAQKNTHETNNQLATYTNPDYGFKLTLNHNWANYKVFKKSNPREIYYKFCVPTSDPLWTEGDDIPNSKACLFSISVISNQSWSTMTIEEQERYSPGVLGQKDGLRFLFTPGQDIPQDLVNIDFGWESLKSSFQI